MGLRRDPLGGVGKVQAFCGLERICHSIPGLYSRSDSHPSCERSSFLGGTNGAVLGGQPCPATELCD
eukprot:COSAG06_NODE_58834_length_276_cov_0.576271_1_plen_66_part_10